VLQGSRENQSRILLGQLLSRVRRAQQDRYKKMRRARIDLSGLRHLAEDILDDPMTVTTRSTFSIPEPQPQPLRHSRYQRYDHEPEPPARAPTHRELPRTAPAIGQDIVDDRPPLSTRRPEAYPISDRTVPECRPVRQPNDIQDTRPPPNYDPRNDRRRGHSSIRSRSPSISREPGTGYDSGFVDESPRLRTSHINHNSHPPIAFETQQERLGTRRNRSKSRPDSIRRESDDSYDSGFVDDSPTLRTSHVNENSRPPISLETQRDRSRRHRKNSRSRSHSTTRKSDVSYDSGFVEQSPRLRTSHVNDNSCPPISYDTQRELLDRYGRHRKRSRSGSSSDSQDSGFVDGSVRYGRSDVAEDANIYEQEGSSRRRNSSDRPMDVDRRPRYADESSRYPRQQVVEDSRQLPEIYFVERRYRRREGTRE
jgi:hypothetical protein